MPELRQSRSLADESGFVSLQELWHPEFHLRGNHSARYQEALAALVQSGLARNEPEIWGECSGVAKSSRPGELPDSMVLAS